MGEGKLSRRQKKDKQAEEICRLIEANGGIVKASQLYTLGLDYRRLQTFVKCGLIERVKKGYYCVSGKKLEEEDLVCAMFPDGVLCMESALYYHQYLKKKPFQWSIAIDKNTSKARFHIEYPLVQPYYTEPEVLKLGAEEIAFGSSKMLIYSKERLICDILKYESRMEREDLQQALRAFLADQEKDIAKLLVYAKERRVLSKIRNQIGVWL